MTYSVDELQRAAEALRQGHFRPGAGAGHRRDVRSDCSRWVPTESVVVVAGVAPRVGTTSVALALAEAFSDRARLLETAPLRRSGIGDATTAELGESVTRWRRATRANLLVERSSENWVTPDDVRIPDPPDRDVTVVDIGWDLDAVLESNSWMRDAVLNVPLVLVASASLPDLTALERALRVTGRTDDAQVVLVGLMHRHLPRAVRQVIGPAITGALRDGRLHLIRSFRDFASMGLTSDDLPARVGQVGRDLAARFRDDLKGSHHDHA